jgi:hypothetical protein
MFMATVRTDQKQRALMRAVPESFSKALASYFGSGPTDIAAAKSNIKPMLTHYRLRSRGYNS